VGPWCACERCPAWPTHCQPTGRLKGLVRGALGSWGLGRWWIGLTGSQRSPLGRQAAAVTSLAVVPIPLETFSHSVNHWQLSLPFTSALSVEEVAVGYGLVSGLDWQLMLRWRVVCLAVFNAMDVRRREANRQRAGSASGAARRAAWPLLLLRVDGCY
jgi:hypothetical protein